MSCSPFDLKDYFFGVLEADGQRAVETHVAACAACREELQALNLVRANLLAAPDEEPPRRIAFVSDPVFEPRWWQRLWRSGPQLGFVSAGILAAAILVHAVTRPAPPVVPPPAPVDVAAIEHDVAQRVAKAVAESETRQAARFEKAMAERERELEFQRRADLATMQEAVSYLKKTMGVNIARINRGDFGATQ